MRLLWIGLLLALVDLPVHGQNLFSEDFEPPVHVPGNPVSTGNSSWQGEFYDCINNTYSCLPSSNAVIGNDVAIATFGQQYAVMDGATDDFVEFAAPYSGDLTIRLQLYIPSTLDGEFWMYGADLWTCPPSAATVNAAMGLVFKVCPQDSTQFFTEAFECCSSTTTGLPWTGTAPQGALFPTDEWVEVRFDWHEVSERGEYYVNDQLVAEGLLEPDVPGAGAALAAWIFWRGPVCPSEALVESVFVDDFTVGPASVLPITEVSTTVPAGTDDVELTWTPDPAQVYDSFSIVRDGVVVQTVAGTVTSMTDTGVPPGPHAYQVRGFDANGEFTVTTAIAEVPSISGPVTDLVFAPLDGWGIVESGAVLADALQQEGISAILRGSLPDTPELQQFETLWICLGVHYQVHVLTAAEEIAILDFLNSGTPENPKRLYIEGGELGDGYVGYVSSIPASIQDLLGIDVGASSRGPQLVTCTLPNGVEGVSASWLSGFTATVNCVSALNLDTIPPIDPAVDVPILIAAGGSDPFALHHERYPLTSDYFETIASTVEFGAIGDGPGCPGCAGDRATLLDAYLDQFLDDWFVRGELNEDGTTNIADAVFLLNALFPIPSFTSRIRCRDAADCNDDGTVNIADVVYLLNALFVPGATPLPDPSGSTPGDCGPDPTEDALRCAKSTLCP